MPGRVPPRYVPTLTEVVHAPPISPVTPVTPVPTEPGPGPALPTALSEDQIVHRVMQRIDLTLDRRLREAIAATVLEQTRLLGPLLRDEIEAAVRQTVSQALAEELTAGASGSGRTDS